MADNIYTKKRSYQFNGPNNSSDYNERIEENYKDLVVLYNMTLQAAELISSSGRTASQELMAMKHKLDALEVKLQDLEAIDGQKFVTFNGDNKTVIDNTRFDATAYKIEEVDRLSDSREYPGLFLPPAGASSPFQSSIVLNGDSLFVPDSVETIVEGQTGSADTVDSVVETTQPELCFGRTRGINWERNIITDSPDSDGAIMTLYVTVPPDVSPNPKCNYVWFDPYPTFGVDILEVAVTTKVNPNLAVSDNYIPLNSEPLNFEVEESIGYVAPGGWDGDADLLASKRLWLFDPRQVTALKIKLRQRNYTVENGNYVYTYGANFLDVGYLKVLNTGKTIIRYEKTGTFDEITNVIPKIYNVSPAYLPDVFSYRTIYETAENSGVYTVDPVELSTRAWIEITLSKAPDGTTPLLSGLTVETS